MRWTQGSNAAGSRSRPSDRSTSTATSSATSDASSRLARIAAAVRSASVSARRASASAAPGSPARKRVTSSEVLIDRLVGPDGREPCRSRLLLLLLFLLLVDLARDVAVAGLDLDVLVLGEVVDDDRSFAHHGRRRGAAVL